MAAGTWGGNASRVTWAGVTLAPRQPVGSMVAAALGCP